MKQFLTLVFGGLTVVFAGIGIAYLGHVGWVQLEPHLPTFSLSTFASSVLAQPTDGTDITGFIRHIRFSADQEEDMINSAIHALPAEGDRRISASAYVVRNITKGDSFIEHNSDQVLPIASLTKLVTAVVARRLIAPTTRIAMSERIMSTYGNTAQFKVGETLTAEDLMYPLLMVSSNDAAEALAQSYGRKKFIQTMNDFTQDIGIYHTAFSDPSGLSPFNVSSAKDLATLLQWIRENDPEILQTTLLKSKTVRSHTWVNPTHFLNWSNYQGGKNGYIPESNRTAASLFTLGKDKNLYAVIVLGSDSRDGDELKLLEKIKQ